MRQYQPDRKDLLINTAWGIPSDTLSAEEAKNRNFVLFEKRWVTIEEKELLKKQNDTYRSLRAIGLLFAIVAVAPAYFAFIRDTYLSSIISPTVFVINAFIFLVTAIGLWEYSGWARYVATALAVLSIFSGVGLITTPIVLYYLHNSVARQIFLGEASAEIVTVLPDSMRTFKLGLFSLLLFPLGPVAIVKGLQAIRRNKAAGLPRPTTAMVGIALGLVGTLACILLAVFLLRVIFFQQ
ncbi:MAG: hypothetical protein WC769_09065 [Thermodesulfovibrionales bacterium]|jgi:hypothetical protein